MARNIGVGQPAQSAAFPIELNCGRAAQKVAPKRAAEAAAGATQKQRFENKLTKLRN